jgi:arginine decarboxylase
LLTISALGRIFTLKIKFGSINFSFYCNKEEKSMYVPSKMFLTCGVGRHREKLASFEMCLRDCKIAQFNLVRVSSIYPPSCKMVSPEKGLKELAAGQVVNVVMSEAATSEPRRLLAASVGVAIPRDPTQFGYLSEHHSYGQTKKKAGDYAEDLAAEMLATVMGVRFDPEKSWDEKREVWKISGKFVRTANITKTALGDNRGCWTTVIAAAVLVP